MDMMIVIFKNLNPGVSYLSIIGNSSSYVIRVMGKTRVYEVLEPSWCFIISISDIFKILVFVAFGFK